MLPGAGKHSLINRDYLHKCHLQSLEPCFQVRSHRQMSQAISKANAMLGDMQLKSTQLVPLELIPFNLDIKLGIQEIWERTYLHLYDK